MTSDTVPASASWLTRCRTVASGKDMPTDRKSTRLNSSHPSISYAVFCLKKKKKKITTFPNTQNNPSPQLLNNISLEQLSRLHIPSHHTHLYLNILIHLLSLHYYLTIPYS